MTEPILQSHLPFVPWTDARTWRLPGILPVEGDDWLRQDDAFAAQMAERDRLIATNLPLVHALLPQGQGAAAELYRIVLDLVSRRDGYVVGSGSVRRPDGVVVPLDPAAPLVTLGRLVQEDLCLMEPMGAEHGLTGAILCFPANWTLAEKIGRPLTGIHIPVAPYDGDVARRVQRLFDAIRPGQPLQRYNALIYDDPVLFQPRAEGTHRPPPQEGLYLRSERQCLLRLPQSGAVVFAIHTHVVRMADLSDAARAAMPDAGLMLPAG